MKELNCLIKKRLHPEKPELTVGEVFDLACRADEPLQLDLDKLRLQLKPIEKYTLQLQKVTSVQENELQMQVVSNVLGQHQMQDVQLSDGTQTFTLNGLQFTVASVQDPQAPVTEPYPSQGPFGLGVPWWHVGAAGSFVAVFLLVMGWRLWRQHRMKKALAACLKQAGPQAPAAEAFTSIRKWHRSFPELLDPQAKLSLDRTQAAKEELKRIWGLFVTRTLQVPYLSASASAQRRYLSDDLGLQEPEVKLIKRLHAEFHGKVTPAQARDLLQLEEWVRDLIPMIAEKRKDPV